MQSFSYNYKILSSACVTAKYKRVGHTASCFSSAQRGKVILIIFLEKIGVHATYDLSSNLPAKQEPLIDPTKTSMFQAISYHIERIAQKNTYPSSPPGTTVKNIEKPPKGTKLCIRSFIYTPHPFPGSTSYHNTTPTTTHPPDIRYYSSYS